MGLGQIARRLGVFAIAAAGVGASAGCIHVHSYRWDDDWERALREEDERSRPMIGVNTSAVSEALAQQTGVDADRSTLISHAYAGRPADLAGVDRFDIVVAINGDKSASPRNLQRVIRETPPGESVVLTIVRAGTRREITVTPRPAAELARQRPADF